MREKFEKTILEKSKESLSEQESCYVNSGLFKMVQRQEQRGERPGALFTDVDNTFYREERDGASKQLFGKAMENSYPVVAITGNDFPTVNRRIESGELPRFQAIAGAVGTEVWVLHDEGYHPRYIRDEFFHSCLTETGYDRKAIVRNSREIIQKLGNDYPESRFNFQIPEKENQLEANPEPDYQPFKVSFHFFSDKNSLEKITADVAAHFPDQAVIVCEEIGYNENLPPEANVRKYCLDILPVTKADAVDYIARVSGVQRGIVAGDSGNDSEMLLKSEILNGVLVGGYKPEAKRDIDAAIEHRKKGERSFQRIKVSEGTDRLIYIEQKPERMAAESILHAAEILRRAEHIKSIRGLQIKEINST